VRTGMGNRTQCHGAPYAEIPVVGNSTNIVFLS
jgi:hypothetical protein